MEKKKTKIQKALDLNMPAPIGVIEDEREAAVEPIPMSAEDVLRENLRKAVEQSGGGGSMPSYQAPDRSKVEALRQERAEAYKTDEKSKLDLKKINDDLDRQKEEARLLLDEGLDRKEWASLASLLAQSFTQLAAAQYGLRTGQDMSGLKFSQPDWQKQMDRLIGSYDRKIKEITGKRDRNYAALKEEAEENRLSRLAGVSGKIETEQERLSDEETKKAWEAKRQAERNAAARAAQAAKIRLAEKLYDRALRQKETETERDFLLKRDRLRDERSFEKELEKIKAKETARERLEAQKDLDQLDKIVDIRAGRGIKRDAKELLNAGVPARAANILATRMSLSADPEKAAAIKDKLLSFLTETKTEAERQQLITSTLGRLRADDIDIAHETGMKKVPELDKDTNIRNLWDLQKDKRAALQYLETLKASKKSPEEISKEYSKFLTDNTGVSGAELTLAKRRLTGDITEAAFKQQGRKLYKVKSLRAPLYGLHDDPEEEDVKGTVARIIKDAAPLVSSTKDLEKLRTDLLQLWEDADDTDDFRNKAAQRIILLQSTIVKE